MLQNIRDSARGWLAWVIVAIISVPFALWGIQEYLHPAPKRVIAEVNDVELSETELQQELAQRQRELRQLREREQQLQAMAQNPEYQQDPEFFNEWLYTFRQIQERTNDTRETVLAQMIAREVLVQSAVDADMRIGDALLAGHIHNDPLFKEENKFSQEQYEQILRYQGLTPAGYENKIRRALLREQIRQGVLRSALATEYDQQQRSRLENQQRFVSHLIIPAARFQDSVTITEVDIETYYKDHATQYMTPEKVSIEYVELSQKDVTHTDQVVDEQTLKERYQERKASFTTPIQWKARHILVEAGTDATIAQIEAAKKKAQDLLAKIRANESFEELAKQFSDDPGSKEKGGDLGWFGPDRMVKPFEDAVKSLQVGEVSKLVKSQFGFHLIKLEGIKPEKVKHFAEVRDQLEKELRKEQAESKFDGQVIQFADLAFLHSDSLGVLAQNFNLEIKTTELFDRTGSQQQDSLLSNRKVIDAAFSEQVLIEGYNSDVIEIGEQHVVVLRLKDHKPTEAIPQADVKDKIVTALKREKTQAEALTLGKSILEQIKQHNDPDVVVKTHNLDWLPAHWIGRKDTTLKQPLIVREAFKMGRTTENKALYTGIQLDQGDYALIAVLDIKDGEIPSIPTSGKDNEKPDPQQQAKEQQQLVFGLSEFNQLLSNLKARADIKDYSDKLREEEI